MEWSITIAAAAFLLQGGALIWKLSSSRAQIYEKIMEVEKDVLKSQLDISETYVEKTSFAAVMSNLDSRLIRLEAKLDKALDLA